MFYARARRVTLALLASSSWAMTVAVSACSGGSYAPPYINPSAGSDNLGGLPEGGDAGTGSTPGASGGSGQLPGSGGGTASTSIPCYDFATVSSGASISASGDRALLLSPLGAVLVDPLGSQILGTFPGLASKILTSALSPDGEKVLIAEQDLAVRLWSVKDQKVIFEMGVPSAVRSVAFVPQPSGDLILLADARGRVSLINPALGTLLWQRETSTTDPLVLVVQPDGKALWMTARGNLLALDIETGDELESRFYNGLDKIAFSEDGNRLALDLGPIVSVVDPDGLTPIVDIATAPLSSSQGLALNKDGRKLYRTSGSAVQFIDVGSAQTSQIIQLEGNHYGAVLFDNDTRLLVPGETTEVLDTQTGGRVASLGSNGISKVVHLSDSRLATEAGGYISVWDLTSGRWLGVPPGEAIEDSWYDGMFVQANGALAGITHRPGVLDELYFALFNPATTELLAKPTADKFQAVPLSRPLISSLDGKWFIGQGTTGFPNVLSYWDAETGEQELSFQAASDINDLRPSPTDNVFAVAGPDGIELWDVETKKRSLSMTDVPTEALAIAFSPDGKLIAGSTLGGGLFVWSTVDGSRKHVLFDDGTSGTDPFSTVAYLGDGTVAVIGDAVRPAASTPGIITLIEVESGRSKGQLFSHRDSAFLAGELSASADGKYLAMTSAGTGVRVWCLDELAK